MSLYLLINILIIIVPLIFSFEKNVQYYKKFPAVFLSISIVGFFFVIWDSIATSRGDWGFNEEYILGIRVFRLPVEELLFFITVPFSSIFVYETINFYIKEKSVELSKNLIIGIIVILLLFSLFFSSQYYTFTVLLFTVIYLVISLLFNDRILKSKVYWLYILVNYIPFLIVNYILTSLPIVWYNENAILNIRVTTIPVEDFLYSFALLSFYLFFYLLLGKKWQIKKILQ